MDKRRQTGHLCRGCSGLCYTGNIEYRERLVRLRLDHLRRLIISVTVRVKIYAGQRHTGFEVIYTLAAFQNHARSFMADSTVPLKNERSYLSAFPEMDIRPGPDDLVEYYPEKRG